MASNRRRSSGVLIQKIVGSSLAELSGFQAGDLVQEVNGHEVQTQAEIFKWFDQSLGTGNTTIKVLRGNSSIAVQMWL